MTMRWLVLTLLLIHPALADTPCPSVSNGVSILSVNIVNAPFPVAFAGLDLETHYLSVTFTNRTSRLFIAVPQSAVQGLQTQWANIAHYRQAIMQEQSTCPLLTPDGKLIWAL
jgi:hypothetical protein